LSFRECTKCRRHLSIKGTAGTATNLTASTTGVYSSSGVLQGPKPPTLSTYSVGLPLSYSGRLQGVVEGEVKEYTVQDKVEHAIQRECKICFSLAHSAPIMTTLLGERLRCFSNKALAQSIITCSYNIPSDMDPATRLILEEIARLGIKLVNGEGNEIIIPPEEFKHFWKRVNKLTSSSMSGIHYGHYRASIQDDLSTEILTQNLTVIGCSGIPQKSWIMGLQVMLEKIAGVCLVKKLQNIQLYEADFNCYN
jgi:hypothetical protein